MFQAACIGACIARELAADQDLTLFGTTSRGCFLQSSSGWTTFLTEESPRGPLTINLPAGSINPIKTAVSKLTTSNNTVRSSIALHNGVLHFSPTVLINLGNVSYWQPDSPQRTNIQPVEIRHKTAAEAIQIILEQKGASNLTGILPDLIPILGIPDLIMHTKGPYSNNLHALITSLHLPEPEKLEQLLADFLGQGGGLTPSGDDFLLGFFLTLERWGDALPKLWEHHPGQIIAALAHTKTTHLSASLISCAAQGHADERLIVALDSLMTADTCKPASLEGLLTWGNSSGLDALAGMLTASLFNPTP